MFRLQLGTRIIIGLASSDAINEVCVTNAASCSARPRLLNTDVISGGGRSPLLANGDTWSIQRRLLTRAVLQERHLPDLTVLLNAELNSIMDRLAVAGRNAVTVRLHADVLDAGKVGIAMRLLTASSSEENADERDAVYAAVEAESRHFGATLADFVPLLRPFFRLREFRSHVQRFHAIFSRWIQRRQTEIARGRQSATVLDLLLVERERIRSTGHPEVDRHCDDEALPYMLYNFFGAMNPTHITVMRAVRLLLQHPEVLRRTRDEMDRVLGPVDLDRPPKSVDIDRLVLLRAVVQETMRLQPPTPSLVPRLVTKDIVTGQGYLIPRGAILLASVGTVGHDERHWTQPDEFRPERFLRDQQVSPDLRNASSHLLAFGVGPRGCPARLLGTRIVLLWLVHLFQRFDLKLADAESYQRNSTVDEHMFDAIPQDFRLCVTPREPASHRFN